VLTDLTSAAIIILAVEAMLCLIIPLALTIAIAYLLVRTRQFLPPKFRLARLQAQRVNDVVNRTGARMTDSLASAEAKYTQMETLVRTLFRPTKKDQS
jgi:fructose 1,6-bisphosphatase